MENFTAAQITHIVSLQCHIKRSVRDAQGAQRCETQWSNGAKAEPGAARRRERSERRNARKKISCPRLPSCAKIFP